MESKDKRRQSGGLHKIPKLQTGKHKAKAYGLDCLLEKKRSELMNTGHIMSDETFITHLLNSLPQTVYEGAILVIKEQLRKSILEITEIEQILEDKFQEMKQAKGWEEEEDDYALFVSPSNKKWPKKAFKGRCGYCGEFGHKAADCPNKKSNQNKGQKPKN